jgi:hypothetical protein
LQEYLQRQAVLEAQNVTTWGGAEYEDALQTLATADAAFANGDFGSAKSGYEAAASKLDELEHSRPRRLTDALARGGIALDQYDAITAKNQFEIALAIDPGNKAAQTGAGRAENVEQLAQLLARDNGTRKRLRWPHGPLTPNGDCKAWSLSSRRYASVS